MTLMLLMLLALDEIDDAKKELADKAYGNYWDRIDTCRALGRNDQVRAAEVLVSVLDDTEMPIREAAVVGLARMKSAEVRKYLLDIYPKLKEETRRANLLWAFRRMEEKGALALAIGALGDKAAVVRDEAARLLAVLADPSAAAALEKVLKDPSAEAREQILLAYAICGGAAAKIEDHLGDSNPRIRAAALLARARCKDPLPRERLDAAVKDKGVEPKIAAAEVAGDAGIDVATILIDDKEWRVRAAAIQAIEEAWDKRGIDLLVTRLAKEDGRLRLDIVLALQLLTGKELGYDPKAWKTWWEANKDTFEMPKKGAKRVAGKGETKASFFNLPILSKRVVFVIDFSGSMKNEDEIYQNKRKIDVALDELEKAIGGMETGSKVNVILLSTEATARKKRIVSPKMIEVGPPNKKKISDFVRSSWKDLEDIKRGRGDIYDAVVEGFDDAEVDTVILLSDGKPTYGKYLERDHIEASLREIHRFRRATVHTVLIGSKGIDRECMERMAEATRGLLMERK